MRTPGTPADAFAVRQPTERSSSTPSAGRPSARQTASRGAVVGQGLAGPFAGDQDAAAGVAAVLGPVRLALALARDERGPGVLRLDPVAEPVRARRRAGLIPQGFGQPVRVRPLCVR